MSEFDKQIEKAFEEKFDKDFIKYLKSNYGENVFSDLPDYEINDKAIHYHAGAKQGQLNALKEIKTLKEKIDDLEEELRGELWP